MKSFFLGLFGVLLSSALYAANPGVKYHAKIEPVWSLEAKDLIENPESAFFDRASGKIYISNVAGGGTEKDGRGWILSVGLDGKGAKKIIEGLNAPKGLRASKGILWVTDIDELLSISLSDGKIKQRIKFPDAKFLNDPAIAEDGTLYVSDMLLSRIYMVKPGAKEAEVYMTGPQLGAPNGLLIKGDKLIVAAWGIPEADFSTKVPGDLYEIDLPTKKITKLTKKPAGNLDGLEAASQDSYFVSDWMAGKLFRITAKGNVFLLASGFEGSADLGFDSQSKLLILPRMKENKVSALKMP